LLYERQHVAAFTRRLSKLKVGAVRILRIGESFLQSDFRMKCDYRFNAIDPNSYFVTSKELDKEEADHGAKPLLRLGAPSINNLALTRRVRPLLTAEEEAELLLTRQ
jgi:hypothetical protein